LVVSKTGLLKASENPDGSRELTGVSFQRSEIAIKHITDGTSKTLFAGEKYLDNTAYDTGKDTGDNETWCTGHNNDNFRTTGWNAGNPTEYLPRPDGPLEIGSIFGSAHPTTWNASYCDGHVESISYEVDPLVHRYKGNRSDGIGE
jgi:prepilin-type processing-associated H-X9-DG protein